MLVGTRRSTSRFGNRRSDYGTTLTNPTANEDQLYLRPWAELGFQTVWVSHPALGTFDWTRPI